MKKNERIDFIFQELQRRYEGSTTELHYETPFQLLASVILSAQCTDKRVNMVTPHLFAQFPDAQTMSKASVDDIFSLIQSISYPNSKAKNLLGMAKKLHDLHHGGVPNDFKALVELPWVWEKTAKVVLHVLYDENVIAVDTHVHRIANRLWLVKTNSPLQTSKQLEKVVPEHYKSFAHHGMILFGRYHCTAIKPRCSDCPFQQICPHFKKVLSKNGKHK